MADDSTKQMSRREFEEYKKVTRRSLNLQAKEYERRLRSLNGEHKRISQIVEKTVQQGAFEDYKKLIEERVDALRRAEDERRGGMILLRILGASGALALILSVLNSLGVHAGQSPPPVPQVYYVPAAPGTLVPSNPPQQTQR